VRVIYTTRRAAERAFTHGKSWQGHNLQLAWLKMTPVLEQLVLKRIPRVEYFKLKKKPMLNKMLYLMVVEIQTML